MECVDMGAATRVRATTLRAEISLVRPSWVGSGEIRNGKMKRIDFGLSADDKGVRRFGVCKGDYSLYTIAQRSHNETP
jgi:hypothetical protein